MIEKAYKKLALDALVIQQGRLQENQKNLNKDGGGMVRYGADKIFDGAGTGSTITDDDIETIIAKARRDQAAQREDGRFHRQGAQVFHGRRRVAVRVRRQGREGG